MFLFLKRTRVDWLVAETSRQQQGLRTDTPAGDVDSHNIVCSWCAQAHVPIHACDFTNGYLQGVAYSRKDACSPFEVEFDENQKSLSHMAEAYALCNAVEHGLRVRAAIVEYERTSPHLSMQAISPNTKQIERFRPRIFPSMVPKLQDEDCGFD